MAKKKPSAVEKRSKGPYMAIAAGVCFALAVFSVVLLAAGGTVPALMGLADVLRGLGGDLRFALPLVFFWLGLRLARGGAGHPWARAARRRGGAGTAPASPGRAGARGAAER